MTHLERKNKRERIRPASIREALEGRFCFSHTGAYQLPRKEELKSFFISLKKAGLSGDAEVPESWIDAFGLLERLIEESNQEKKILFLDL